ncbi:MAG: deoxyribodipyrimidine photo-lyase [Pseudomonadota bacterium]
MLGVHIIWFRDDLRVHDHAALRAACQNAERDGAGVLALYILPKGTRFISRFLYDGLRDLQTALDRRGAQLHVRYGTPIEVLSDLHRAHRVLSVQAHEASDVSQVDRDVEAWAMRAGLPYRVYQQFGPLPTASDFFDADSSWEAFMSEPRREASDIAKSANIGVGAWPEPEETVASSAYGASSGQGGRKAAIQLLRAILAAPGSSSTDAHLPESGTAAYQTLAPYLERGMLSVREAWQAAISARQQSVQAGQEIRAAMIASFIQGLPTLHLEKHPRRQGPRRLAPRGNGASPQQAGAQLSLGFAEPRRG